jgi:hypothetical protein
MIRTRHLCFLAALASAFYGCADAATHEGDGPSAIDTASTKNRSRPVDAAALAHAYQNRIDLKLREETGLRARGGALIAVPHLVRGAPPAKGLAAIAEAIGGRKHAFAAMHDQLGEEALEQLRAEGEARTGEKVPDLNGWVHLYVETGSPEELAEIIGALNAIAAVEVAEPSRIGVTPSMTIEGDTAKHPVMEWHPLAPWPSEDALARVPRRPSIDRSDRTRVPATTISAPQPEAEGPGSPPPDAVPDYGGQQAYKGAAPTGVDTNWLQGFYFNADGLNWGYTDVEYDWNRSHTDLTKIADVSVMVNGTYAPPNNVWPCQGNGCQHHGTAVVGVLSSDGNGYGTTGMVPAAGVKLSAAMTSSGYNLAGAISAAASQYFAGAVILIEQQTSAGWDCNGDNAQKNVGGVMVPDYGGDLVPVEYAQSIRDAIKAATAAGRIVVEAAGNGNCDLDLAGFGGYFSATDATKDSGAILVGAGERDTRERAGFSTYGARVDTHAEGDGKVTTTGYGGLFSANGLNQYYTGTFNGTSSASPIITGSVVALSSLLWFTNGSIYDPREIRDVLRRDGTAQGTTRAGHVGPRPDMRKAVTHMIARHSQVRAADFDGDGKSDYAVFDEQNGLWSIYMSRTLTVEQYYWGQLGDIPVPADYAGDGRAEIAVWRPSNGMWYVRGWDVPSFNVQWGTNGDVPVPMDYDGNGKAQMTVMRPPGVGGTQYARWYILSDDRATYTWGDWGEFGDVAMAADVDGDGRDDRVVFRGTTGTWYIAYARGGSRAVQWGQWGDVPMMYKSGGHPAIAVWRPGNQTFYTQDLVTGGTGSAQWGAPGDVPRMMDTNGDGSGERVVFRPSTGIWYNLDTWYALQFGSATDVAIGR